MEKEKKKIDVKTIIIVVVTIIAVIEGIVIFTSKGTPGELKEKDVIGIWTSSASSDYYWETFELYPGGTGKADTLKNSRQSSIDISCEIKSTTLNIKTNDTTTGYKVEIDKITSMDREFIYYKVK